MDTMQKDSQKDPATNPTALLAKALVDQVSLSLQSFMGSLIILPF